MRRSNSHAEYKASGFPMADRIPVWGELSMWVHVGRILGAAAAVVGLGVARSWTAGMDRRRRRCGGVARPGIRRLASAVCASLAHTAPRWYRNRRRAATAKLHDSQVSAVALETKKNLSNGELTSITRRFTIWTEDEPLPMRMKTNQNRPGRSAGGADRAAARWLARPDARRSGAGRNGDG